MLLIGENKYWFGEEYEENKKHNALIIAIFLKSIGWTLEAIAGTLGNIEHESTINPGLWENEDAFGQYADPESHGYGLVQWTPFSKLINFAGDDWLTNYDKQLLFMKYEYDNEIQFYSPSMTYHEYAQSNASPEQHAYWFLNFYERPAILDQPWRLESARKWYNYLLFLPNIPIVIDPGTGLPIGGEWNTVKKSKFWLYSRFF